MNLLLIVAFLAGNLYKFSHVSPLDVVVGILWILKLPRILNRTNKLLKPILAFGIVGVISLLVASFRFSPAEISVSAMYLLRFLIYSSLSGVMIQSIKVIPILGISTAIVGIFQYLLYPDTRALTAFGWDPHYYRIVGTLLDPGFTGLILVLTIVYLVINNYKKIWWVIVYLALALTYSRASYLAFFTAFTWLSYQRKTWKYFLVSLCLITVTVTILPRWSGGEGVKLERTSTIWARIASWRKAWQIFSDNPVIGVGFNTYRYAQKASIKSHAGAGSDSSILLVMATTGIIGLLFYLRYIKNLWGINNNLIVTTSLVAVLIHSIFLNSLFYPAVMLWLALLIPG